MRSGQFNPEEKCFQLSFELYARRWCPVVISKTVDCSTLADRQQQSSCRQRCYVYVGRHVLCQLMIAESGGHGRRQAHQLSTVPVKTAQTDDAKRGRYSTAVFSLPTLSKCFTSANILYSVHGPKSEASARSCFYLWNALTKSDSYLAHISDSL